jgi:cysteine-rich repeat protein
MYRYSILAFAAGLAVMAAAPGLATITNIFPDVIGDSPYADSIEAMYRAGIIKGYDTGRYGVNDRVTRGQAATLFDRYDREMVQPLWEQITEVRQAMGLGYCGDTTVQTGEECDDGNNIDGDGCSGRCQLEVGAEGCGSYTVGQRFPATDGCNICTCTLQGIVCTSTSCTTATPCVTSNDCSAQEYCTTEDGDCRSYCPSGSVCLDVCAGICKTRPSTSLPTIDAEVPCEIAGCSGQLCVEVGTEEIGTCEWKNEYACYFNATCERQQSGQCGWTQTTTLQECIRDARTIDAS